MFQKFQFSWSTVLTLTVLNKNIVIIACALPAETIFSRNAYVFLYS